MDQDKKVRENRLRRVAKRQGLALKANGRRDPRALDFGKYALVDAETKAAIAGVNESGRFDLTLDEVEAYLNRNLLPPFEDRNLLPPFEDRNHLRSTSAKEGTA